MKGQILKAIREVGLDTPNVECIVAFKIDQAVIYEYVCGLVQRLRSNRPGSPEDRQGWLAFPEFAHVPVQVAGETLEQLRGRIATLERRIASYEHARRSPEKLRDDKKELRELRRIESATATLFAGAPDLKIDGAMLTYERRRETPRGRRNRKGGKARHSVYGKSTT